MGEAMGWKEQLIFTFHDNPLPDREGVLKILLPDSYFFSLIKFNREQTFWKGIFKNEKVFLKFLNRETVEFPHSKESKVEVLAITRCLIIEKSPSLQFSLNELSQNPCLKVAMLLKKGLVVKFTTDKPEETFLKEHWSFTSKTNGFCPPASCGSEDCLKLGGTSAPVVVNKSTVC
jgi:hypothetical protein